MPFSYSVREQPPQDNLEKINLSTIKEERSFLPDVGEVNIIAPEPEYASTMVMNVHGEQPMETQQRKSGSAYEALQTKPNAVPEDSEEVQLKEAKNKSCAYFLRLSHLSSEWLTTSSHGRQ